MKQNATKQAEAPQNNMAAATQGQLTVVQTKLTVGAHDDAFEREADAVADAVVGTPATPFAQASPSLSVSPTVQREEATDSETEAATPRDKEDLKQQPVEPNFQSLRTPFFDRNVPFMWDANSALGIWRYNFDFFKRFGLDNSWAGKAANLTAPLFIDSQLKASNPKWWEITDQQLNTTSIVGTLPVFSFDADFRNWKPLPFLQKKEEGVQRKCAACEEEEQGARVQTKGEGTPAVSGTVANGIESSRGKGAALDAPTRSFMESRMGARFESVNVHTDSEAAQLSRSLNAQAFTVGRDVYFNEGRYQPQSTEGQHLLAHELTHVLQQDNGAIRRTPLTGAFSDVIPEDEDERMQYFYEQAEFEWRMYDEPRIDKGELDDRDLKKPRVMNRITGLTTSEVSSLMTKVKAWQQKNPALSTTKILEYLEVRTQISTPMPDDAVVSRDPITQAIDSYSFTANNVTVKVITDRFGAAGNETGPTTSFGRSYRWQSNNKGIISGLFNRDSGSDVAINPTSFTVTIQTAYSQSPDGPSGYGRGTTDFDKAEKTTTLRVHEGAHGTDYINYIRTHTFPDISGGIVGKLTVAEMKSIDTYIKNITKDSCELTDQVGFSQDDFLKTPAGQASGIKSCRTP